MTTPAPGLGRIIGINQLNAASSVNSDDVVPIVQGGSTLKATIAQINSVSGTVTSVNVSGGTTGLTTSGGPITSSGTITIAGTLATTNGGTGLTSIGAAYRVLSVNSAGTALNYAYSINQNLQTTDSPTFAALTLSSPLPIASGGTGSASVYAARRALFPQRVVTAAGAVTVTTSDYEVVVNKTVGAATTVTLPSSPVAGDRYVIKDGKGDAASNNITVSPASGTIDGSATAVLNIGYSSLTFSYNGTEWGII